MENVDCLFILRVASIKFVMMPQGFVGFASLINEFSQFVAPNTMFITK